MIRIVLGAFGALAMVGLGLFEEWAVSTSERFEAMDADSNSWLSQLEFATSARERR